MNKQTFILENIDENGFIVRSAFGIVIAKVVKRKNKWCVISQEGKSLGCYPTKEKAVRRLRQIEFFKHKKGSFNLTGASIQKRKDRWFVYDTKGNPIAVFPDRASATALKNEIERAEWFKNTQEWIYQKRKKASLEDIDSLLELVKQTQEDLEKITKGLSQEASKKLTEGLNKKAFEEVPLPSQKIVPIPEQQVGLTQPKLYPPKYEIHLDIKPKQVKPPARDVLEKYYMPGVDYSESEGWGRSFKWQQDPWRQYDPKMPSGLPDAPGEWWMTAELNEKKRWLKKAQEPETIYAVSPELLEKVKEKPEELEKFSPEMRKQLEEYIEKQKAKEELPPEKPQEEVVTEAAVEHFVPVLGRGYPVFWSEFYDWIKGFDPPVNKEVVEKVKHELIKRNIVFPEDVTPEAEEQYRKSFGKLIKLIDKLNGLEAEVNTEISLIKSVIYSLRRFIREYVTKYKELPVLMYLPEIAILGISRQDLEWSLVDITQKCGALYHVLEELKDLMKEGAEYREKLINYLPVPADVAKQYFPLLKQSMAVGGLSTFIRLTQEAEDFIKDFEPRLKKSLDTLRIYRRNFEPAVKKFDYITDLLSRKEIVRPGSLHSTAQTEILTEEEIAELDLYQRIDELEEEKNRLERMEEEARRKVEEGMGYELRQIERTVRQELAGQPSDVVEEAVAEALKEAEEEYERKLEEELGALEKEKEEIENELVKLELKTREIKEEKEKEFYVPSTEDFAQLEKTKEELLKKYPYVKSYDFVTTITTYEYPEHIQEISEIRNQLKLLIEIEKDRKIKELLEDKLKSLGKEISKWEDEHIMSFHKEIRPLQEKFDKLKEESRYKLEKLKETEELETSSSLQISAKIKEFDNYIETAKKEGISIVKANWIKEVLEKYPGWKTDIDTTKKLLSETFGKFDSAGFEIVGREELEEVLKGLEKV